MIKIAVVMPSNVSFEEAFDEKSPFVKGISYWTYMLKEELRKNNIKLVPYVKGKEFKYFLHYDRFRKDVLQRENNKLHIYLGLEPPVVEINHTRKSMKQLATCVYDAVLVGRFDLNDDRIYPIVLPEDIKYIGDQFTIPEGLVCLFSGDKVGFGNELYSLRRKVIRYAEKNEASNFAFFGPNWGNPYSNYKTYRGKAEDKAEISKHFKFNFCFENELGLQGYVTEKIFDSMATGLVPVYYGAPDIDEFVPKECYIDFGKFSSIEDCFTYLKNMKDAEYLKIKAQIFQFMNSKETIEKYAATNMAKIIEHMITNVEIHKHRRLENLDIIRLKQFMYSIACRVKRIIGR